MVIFSTSICSKEYLVANKNEYEKVRENLKPGDTVILKNGIWENIKIRFNGIGTKNNPITLKAETDSKVVITGNSSLRLAGQYLVVSGLLFKDGNAPTSSVIEFRDLAYQGDDNQAHNSRVTNTVIDSFNRADPQDRGNWVVIHGKNNRVDHNFFRGKNHFGALIDVRIIKDVSNAANHSIDHNYFGYVKIPSDKRGQSILVGNSASSFTHTNISIKNNYFELCEGSRDLMLIKSSGNIIEGNSVVQSFGSIAFRNGNGNLADKNVILGNNIVLSGGIRISGRDHIVRNNYIESVGGTGYDSALSLTNGKKNPKMVELHQVENALIENNSIIDSRQIEFGTGQDSKKKLAPKNIIFRNNFLSSAKGEMILSKKSSIKGIKFSNNKYNGFKDKIRISGFDMVKVEPKIAANGLYYPPMDSKASQTGISRDIQPYLRVETGVKWYPLDDEYDDDEDV